MRKRGPATRESSLFHHVLTLKFIFSYNLIVLILIIIFLDV
ncbi:hypothetical protein GTCCBUS3UF5_30140 [Geobacillus thermoleovorans CCB_US3_UF5]|uniref:Uncharacterized protein n=1 Tax=Geobacillus thermoleovorans CCB_US3_UF5 TaxID=1111068 RepID=A0ABM5MKK9_GEOTH|nr:hypothetical protein GTCCBUS3UF5_30140 [Geobacillus thermoleovorans CCB_US3_UF5]GAJ57932.1 hypothetical protein B23_1138 [Geobacillus thermoleovorans B23]